MKQLRISLAVLFVFSFLFGFSEKSLAQAGGTNPELVMYRHNSGPNGAVPINAGDHLGNLKWNGLTAIGFVRTGASIQSFTTSVSPGFLQANLIFRTGGTIPPATTVGLHDRMIITQEGRVGIGTNTPGALFRLHTVGNTFTSGDYYGRIHMDASLGTDGFSPTEYLEEAYFEYKRTMDMVPTAGLNNLLSRGGLLTLAPSINNPSPLDSDHQLFFNRGGIFHRQDNANDGAWSEPWVKLLTSADISGRPNLIARFLPPDNPSSRLGEGQLFDNGTNVVIGGIPPNPPNLDPTPVFFNPDLLTVNGTTRINGRMYVGTAVLSPPHPGVLEHTLYIGGSMICTEAKVELIGTWPDFVFDENYPLTPLSEKEKFVRENKHLPGVPTAQEVQENGLPLGATQQALTQNLEEVHLYLFEMGKRLIALEQQNKALQQEIETLKAARR